jgi:hypothetical protein
LIPLGIYGVIAGLFIAIVVLPAISIGFTRVYMILSADDEDLAIEQGDEEVGPGFVGGL